MTGDEKMTAEELLLAIRQRCRIVYHPIGEKWHPGGPDFPIVHSTAAGKDQWDEIVKRLALPPHVPITAPADGGGRRVVEWMEHNEQVVEGRP